MIIRENTIKVNDINSEFMINEDGIKYLPEDLIFFDLEHYVYKKPKCIGVFGACEFDKKKSALKVTQYMIENRYESIDIQKEYEKKRNKSIGLKNLEKQFDIIRESEVISGSNLAKTFHKIMKDKDYIKRMPEDKIEKILLYNEQDVVNLFHIYMNWNKYIDYEEELCEIKSIEDIEEDTEINQFDNIEEDTKNLEKDFEVSYENINDNN